jgi:hypothetical protein
MTAGTAKLQIITDGLAAQDLTGSDLSAAGTFTIELPDCQLQSVVSGDATVHIAQISGSGDGLYGNV